MGVSANGQVLLVIAGTTGTDNAAALYDLDSLSRIGEPVHVQASASTGAIRPDALQLAIAGDGLGTAVWTSTPITGSRPHMR